MSLEKYNKKRDFTKTTEPSGKKPAKKVSKRTLKNPQKGKLVFVVQKHDASHLHYDFRMESEGVLLSWAVPKGPSLDPSVKRLAMMVEDHPFDYKDFEGIIAEGNYGAGEVIVWDKGEYIPIGGGESKEENEKLVKKMVHKGDLKFVLLGKKIKGEYALVKIRNKDSSKDNAWLLIKKDDVYASEEDLTKKNKSVISRKTIESIKRSREKKDNKEEVWKSNK
ncbi:hypothetical protein BH10BAC5_BH10BAC5_04810 [soil metagenome]